MGKQKLILPYGTSTILEAVLNKSKTSRINDTFVVVPHNDEQRKEIVLKNSGKLVPNPNPEAGMGNSLAVGIKHLPATAEAVIILLADQPSITVRDINRIYDYFTMHQSKEIIVQTLYADERKGHPILFSKAFFLELADLKGDTGGKEIIRKNLKNVFTVKSPDPYPSDIDTPEDYASLLSYFDKGEF